MKAAVTLKKKKSLTGFWLACGSLEATDGYQQAKTHHAVVTVYSGRGLGSFNDYSGHKNEHDSITKYEFEHFMRSSNRSKYVNTVKRNNIYWCYMD